MTSRFNPWSNLRPTLHTVVHLRPRQIAALLRRRTLGPARRPQQCRAPGCDGLQTPFGFRGPSPEGAPTPNGAVALLHQPAYDPQRFGWDGGSDPLWSYTLHYHGWVSHPRCEFEVARTTLLDWIEEHVEGVGWEPYPTSMRVFHWLGWLARNGGLLPPSELELVWESLSAQLQHLAGHVEVHLDGNHLWTNLAALVAGGLALTGPVPEALVERFAGRLQQTVREQLADDGVHRERTPTYHCLLAEQLAMLVVLAEPRLPALADDLTLALRKMIAALPVFTHPDGDVALWGDSSLGAPVTPRRLAARCKVDLPDGHADARESGFARRQWGPWTLLWNRGDVGMPQQVGHIHADCLAVELSFAGQRMVVDAGTGTYAVGPERAYARSTRAHNTATIGVGDPDQHELWASHRIGKRAEPYEVQRGPGRIVGCVRGVDSPSLHRREIIERGDGFSITDTRGTAAVPGVVRYFLPAEVRVRPGERGITGFLPRGGSFELEIAGAQFALESAPGWRGIGVPSSRTCLSAVMGPEPVTVIFRAHR